MQETEIGQGTILSLDAEERIETDAGVIEILPAWQWVVRQYKRHRGEPVNKNMASLVAVMGNG